MKALKKVFEFAATRKSGSSNPWQLWRWQFEDEDTWQYCCANSATAASIVIEVMFPETWDKVSVIERVPDAIVYLTKQKDT